jgi:SAM-dependent methyltransferase
MNNGATAATGASLRIRCRAVPGEVPYPPLPLANRVGSLESAADPYAYYDELGLKARAGVEAGLPADWSYEGKAVLDFGCGAGRTLRHFLPEARSAEFWGCDIDAESIAWLDENLSPPLHVFENGAEPPLSVPDAKFDLVYAVSVFTHLVESWSSWLLELRRVLKPGGLLVATFMGEGMVKLIAGEDWDEERIGMNVIRYGQSWDLGGPMVLHSPWWIREHWGRGFEVVDVAPSGFGSKGDGGHGTAVLRKTDGEVTREELERVDPGDERELRALQHNVGQLRTEIADLRRTIGHERTLASEVATTKQQMVDSRSWRLTEPLRRAGGLARRRRR